MTCEQAPVLNGYEMSCEPMPVLSPALLQPVLLNLVMRQAGNEVTYERTPVPSVYEMICEPTPIPNLGLQQPVSLNLGMCHPGPRGSSRCCRSGAL